MEWNPDLITPGEIDALKITATQAWADDTRYPRWKGSSYGGGQCYVTSYWLRSRLGGYIGKKAGHFAWLSPDKSYILDLTGDHSGLPEYVSNDGYVPYNQIDNDRTEKFVKRANLIFNNLDVAIKVSADSLVGDAFPGQEPQRQNDIDSQYIHDEPDKDKELETNEYNFFYGNGSLEVSPNDLFDHQDLAKHLNVSDSHEGPMASGHISVNGNKATWEVFSNVDLKALTRVFRNYTDQVGWDWGGIKDSHGQVVSKSLVPVDDLVKLNYVWSNDHLYIGSTSHTVLAINTDGNVACGTVEIVGKKAKITPVYTKAIPQFFEWAEDQGIELYGSSNNLVKRYEDMEQENLGKPDGGDFNPLEGDAEDDTPVEDIAKTGILHCPSCDKIFPSQHLLEKHRRKIHGDTEVEREPEEDGGFPDTDMDKTNPPHFTEQQPTTMPVYGMREASRVDGFDKYARAFKFNENDKYYVSYLNGSPVGYAVVSNGEELKMVYSSLKYHNVARSICDKIERHYPYLYTHLLHDWESDKMRERGWVNIEGNKWSKIAAKEPKDTLEAAIPFVYDIPADTITVGHPGQRTSDIPGKFTPAGIVEGMYEPGGTVNIMTMTTMPYTVDHILTLWYYQYPEFSVSKINLVDAEGKKTKLANDSL